MKIYNTLTRQKEVFRPIVEGKVGMYVCGMTVYDLCHLGHARVLTAFDVIARYLRHKGYDVNYVRNITDIDDKIISRANENGEAFDVLTERFINEMHVDAKALGIEAPDAEPRATAHIDGIIEMVQTLIEKGYAYAAENGDVYYSVRKFEGYGKLSGRSLDDLRAGERVALNSAKRDPLDFVMWKSAKEDEPAESKWESSYGLGRPGWHIECSAMAHDLLGERFDIHGGGIDLQFPHHENEIAQSKCAHPKGGFANYWLHNEMLQVEGKKMSKSLGNFFTVRDLLDQGVPGEVIRFVMLSTHYRKPMDWTEKKRDEATKTLTKWMDLTRDLEPCDPAAFKPDQKLIDALADDLNTHLALTYLNALTAQPQKLLDHARWLGFLSDKSREDDAKARAAYTTSFGSGGSEVEAELANRLDELRQMAMKTKDFSDVDALKAVLLAAGCEVRISKLGTEVIAGPTFDPTKLDVLK